MKGNNQNFMEEAIAAAREGIQAGDGGPFGAVVVLDGEIIGRGHNRVVGGNDPTAHGEISAIRDACRNLKRYDLSGAELYTTCYPCPMCMGAILWARIDKVFYCATSRDAARIGFDDSEFYQKLSNPDCIEQLAERDVSHIPQCAELFAEYENSPKRKKY